MAATRPVAELAEGLLVQAIAGGRLATPEPSVDDVAGRGVVLHSGLVVAAGPHTPRPIDPVAEDFGFTPTAWFAFTVDTARDIAPQRGDTRWAALTVLGLDDGDAVLHFQYEQVWLLRRHGELCISDDDAVWPEDGRGEVPDPHRRAALSFAEG
jgi:hypothetical protein